MYPDKGTKIVLAATVLHNIIFDLEKQSKTKTDSLPPTINEQQHNQHTLEGSALRDYLADYFVTPNGEIPKQENRIH